jgi:hypothetical protein
MGLVSEVYADSAPLDAVYPFILISLQNGSDEVGLGGEFILSGMTYLVRIVNQCASYLPLETAAERVKALLHKASGTEGNGEVFECLQVEPIAYPETGSDGKQYRHLGGLYELVIRG